MAAAMPYPLFVQWVDFFNRMSGKRKEGGGRQQETPSSGSNPEAQLKFFKAFSIQHNAMVQKNAKSGKG